MAGRKGEECVTHRIPSQKDMDRQTVYREEEEEERTSEKAKDEQKEPRQKQAWARDHEGEKLMHPEPLYKYHLRSR